MFPVAHQKLEECAFNALPAIHTLHYDGWVIRISPHGPKRACSVNVLQASTLPLQQKLAYCRELFARHGAQLVFRLTEHAVDPDLDALLDQAGARRLDESLVMQCVLSQQPISVETFHSLEREQWLRKMLALDSASDARKAVHAQLLRNLALPAVFGAIRSDDQDVAYGLTVIDGDYAGVFDVITANSERRKGHARALTLALLAQAGRGGAKLAYLQVVASNQAARALYESLGFVEQYRYWYRVFG